MTTLEAAKLKLWREYEAAALGWPWGSPEIRAAYDRYLEAVTELEREAREVSP